MSNQRTVLYDLQVSQGAKMIDFHGWDMPVQFSSIIEEHHIVRRSCGIFDLGHMGRLSLQGSGAIDFLLKRTCRPLAKMLPGQVRYSLILNQDGCAEDDILISKESDESVHVVVNASNLNKILDLWADTGEDAVEISNLTSAQAMIAVQGPQAAGILASIGLPSDGLKYYQFKDLEWQNVTVRLSRTGYTGEDGFEVFIQSDQACAFWEAVRAAGGIPCGLGCRDTLRLEAGMPLYGNEIDTAHTPIEAGLNFAVGKHGGYQGAEVVLAQKEAGTERVLVGLKMDGKRAARHGYAVLDDGGKEIGVVTSGSLSPTLGYPIAMAYVPSTRSAVGSKVLIDLRGKSQLEAEVVALPFYKRGT